MSFVPVKREWWSARRRLSKSERTWRWRKTQRKDRRHRKDDTEHEDTAGGGNEGPRKGRKQTTMGRSSGSISTIGNQAKQPWRGGGGGRVGGRQPLNLPARPACRVWLPCLRVWTLIGLARLAPASGELDAPSQIPTPVFDLPRQARRLARGQHPRRQARSLRSDRTTAPYRRYRCYYYHHHHHHYRRRASFRSLYWRATHGGMRFWLEMC
jgi:hypothetical protein